MRRWTGLLFGVAALLIGPVAGLAQQSDLLVDAAWLERRLGDRGIRIVDMVTESTDYQKGHIPGAVYLNVDDSRVAVPAGGFRLPTEEEGERLLAKLGIGPDTHVVIYDDLGGLHASRLFFTLDVLGHRKLSILDGGIEAWRGAGGALTREIPQVASNGYRPVRRHELVATAESIVARLGDPAVVLVDARSPAEYRGDDVRTRRGGHIPGAVNIEWRQNLRADGRFKPADELRALYLARGVSPGKVAIAYCQVHHRGAHSYFVLRLLGHPQVAGYDRSWVEWGNRADLPIEK